MKKLTVMAVVLVSCAFLPQTICAAAAKVAEGSSVRLGYSLDADGTPIISEGKKAEMTLVVGQGSHPAIFEQQLIGLKKGDTKDIRLTPDQAYGPHRPELLKRIPKDELPPSFPQQEGVMISGKNGQHPMRVAKILEDSIVLDENHPLAGKTLTYHVRVMDVR